jgi:hypothetical protein
MAAAIAWPATPRLRTRLAIRPSPIMATPHNATRAKAITQSTG